MAMDLLSQPVGNLGQVAGFHIGPDIAQILLHLPEHLNTVSTAQRIGGEIADHAAGPVGILKAAFLVVGNIHAQIFLVQALPFSRYILHFQGTANQPLFDLITDHNMQTIRQLVSLGADQAGLGLIHGPVELFRIHTFQLLREEFLHLGEDSLDKRLAAANDVFIETALAFVDTHGNAAGKGGVIVAIIGTQFVEGMAALVNDGVHGGNQTIFVIMGGDTDILVIELGGIRMLRFRNSTVAPVHAQNLHQIIRELSLDFHGIVLE